MIIGNDCLPACLPACPRAQLVVFELPACLIYIFDMEEVCRRMDICISQYGGGGGGTVTGCMMSTATALMMVIICDFVSG